MLHVRLLTIPFRSALSKFTHRSSDVTIHTAFTHLTREELIERLRKEVAKNRRIAKQNERLQAAKEKMEVTNNHEYAEIFKNLKSSMDTIKERASHPVCQWKSCGNKFDHIEELQQHIYSTHINIEESSTQRQPTYKCNWVSCSHKEFKNRQTFKTHIARHTGKPEDSYFALLLADQAKSTFN